MPSLLKKIKKKLKPSASASKYKTDISGGGSKVKAPKKAAQSEVIQQRGRIDEYGVPRKVKTVAKKTTKPKKQKKNKVFIEG